MGAIIVTYRGTCFTDAFFSAINGAGWDFSVLCCENGMQCSEPRCPWTTGMTYEELEACGWVIPPATWTMAY